MAKRVIFITGGARSGKSGHAIELAKRLRTERVAFIATAVIIDSEMRRRIELHKKTRPSSWKTFEEPTNLSGLLKKIGGSFDLVIVDCLTLFISNLLVKKSSADTIKSEIEKALSILKKMKLNAIIVSNEVGLGIVPANRLARDFRDISGTVNQLVADKSDEVNFMVSGIPWRIK